jgi:hypothetical protein
VVNQALREVGPKVEADIRALYARATGDSASAQKMSLEEIQQALFRRDRAELNAAQQRLAQERAGQVAPPPPTEQRPYAEQMLRLLMTSGQEWEAQLAKIFGPERAHEMRRRHDTYTGLRGQSGCPEVTR